MKNMTEALSEIPALNKQPQLAKAWGTAADMSESCEKEMRRDGYHEGAIKEGIGKASEEFRNAADSICESPIEATLLAALIYSYYGGKLRIPARICPPNHYPPVCGLVVHPQFQLAHYRLDFLLSVRLPCGRRKWINVECDGHDYHQEVSREEWDRDRLRDAFMQQMGLTVYRFTGSEIWQKPKECASKVAINVARWSQKYGAR